MAPTYLAWFPRYDSRNEKTVNEPFVGTTYGNTSFLGFPEPELIFSPAWWFYKNKTAQDSTMYIAIMPKVLNVNPDNPREISPSNTCGLDDPDTMRVTTDNPLGRGREDISMLQCQLYNSTYQTKFNYTNGAQVVSITLARQDEDNPISVMDYVRGADPNGHDYPPCPALRRFGLEEEWLEEKDHNNDCRFDESLLSRLSYQGILQAFTMMLTGDIQFGMYNRGFLRLYRNQEHKLT